MKQRISLSFTGDIMCQREQLAACRTSGGYEFGPLFEPAAEALAASDYLVGNLETPFAGAEAGYTRELYSFNTPDSFAAALAACGFDLVSTANNHCLDRKLSGLKRTLDILDRAGIAHVGTARTETERDRVFLRDINGIRVAFVGCTYGTNSFVHKNFLSEDEHYAVNLLQPQETRPGAIHLLEPPKRIAEAMRRNRTRETVSPYLERLRADIRNCRAAGADFVTVLLHCGGQYNPLPDPFTEFIAGRLRESGADLIVGNHPHIVQKAELYHGAPLFYSLGNFCCTPGESPESRANPLSATSLLLTVTLEKDETGTHPVSASFQVMRSILRGDGKAAVVPAASLPERERQQYADEFRLAVNAFLDRPPETPAAPQTEYTLALNGKKQQTQRNQ